MNGRGGKIPFPPGGSIGDSILGSGGRSATFAFSGGFGGRRGVETEVEFVGCVNEEGDGVEDEEGCGEEGDDVEHICGCGVQER